jgi:hypothetical protein
LFSHACTCQQTDLKRKLEQLKSEAAKTRKKFADTLRRVNEEKRDADIRRSQDTLNKSNKTKRSNKKKGATKKKTAPITTDKEDTSSSLSSEDDTTKKPTSKKTKNKAAQKKKTAPPPKTTEEEDTSLSSSSEDEATKKPTSKKTASIKTTSKKTAPKKRTTSKPAGVKNTTSWPPEDNHEDREGATIKKHSYDNEKELYTVWVSWKKSKKAEWQFLHDMWVDYPEEVKTYRDRHRLTASAWQVPNMEDASFVVRILTMNGPTPSSATFCILFDNGYVEKEAGYSDVRSDAPDLLRAFLYERDL